MTECRTDPRGEGHVFVSPTGDYMTLICFQNGSLARERIRDRYGLDWAGFSAALRATPPGNNGRLMIPWFEPEIVPHVLRPGIRRFGLDESDAPANCRAVVEAQMLSMRIHSAWMGVRPVEIYATGGASANRDILQIMADVHQCPVRQFPVTNSAALGAALRAAHGAMSSAGQPANWAEIARGLAEPQSGARINPRPETAPIYAALAQEYAWHESANR
jgi:xylulokinase